MNIVTVIYIRLLMSVTIDTNVVISAAISQDSNPAIIFEMLVLENIKNYTTQEIIDEVKDVLQRPQISKRLSLTEQEFILNNYKLGIIPRSLLRHPVCNLKNAGHEVTNSPYTTKCKAFCV